MKLESSSSSLSLSAKTHTFGCISLILQRFLCSGTSSTYPSDQITEPCFKSPDFGSETPKDIGDEPGAVARLMGLDAIPVTDKTRVITRSRSVNSWRGNHEIQGKHKRVKSTLDSHKLLEYVELEDDNFFILSFEKDGNEKQLRTRKCKKSRDTRENQTCIEGKENNINVMNVSPGRESLEIGESKQRRKEVRKNTRETKLRQYITENIEEENWIKSYGRWSRDGDLVSCETRTKKEEKDCGNCDDLSPVSVLDYDKFAGVRVTPPPEHISIRKLSLEHESRKRNETIEEDHITLMNIWRENEVRLREYQETWLMICGLTVSELEGSNWVNGKASKLEDLEGIVSEDIVSNILDQLLEETVKTLSLTSQM